jgi:hypothetical protein
VKTVAAEAVLRSLTDRLSALTPQHERRWGTMTAHEMLCHLGDAAEMVLRVRPREGTVPRRQRRAIKVFGLWSPIRWPHGWKTNPRHDPRVAGTRPSDFPADLRRAVAGLQGIAIVKPDEAEPAHGFFGLMTVPDWQRWAYKHTDHHLRQFGL